ncbi:DNA helicase MCM9 [Nematocida sp. AWRm77]|nr:DNA helicase MCM9 [Nematocida sp. AWRm77]
MQKMCAPEKMEAMDLMQEYEKDPEALLSLLQKTCAEETSAHITNVPYSFDLPGFPSSVHINQIVTICGTVLKLGGMKFRNTKNKRIDYQEIQIQERTNMYLPQTIAVRLEDAFVHSCHPGELLRITGVVRIVWNKIRHGYPLDCGYTITALSIEKQEPARSLKDLVLPEAEHALLLDLLEKYAPHISGHRAEKLGLLLCTLGGQTRKDEPGKEAAQSTEELYREAQYKHRASSHMLLVGPSGTGKTDLLLFASKTVSPAVLAMGTGCSSAGLTACAVRENGEWMIEPGALPQADRGICCIDEFTSLRKEEKASILEAMEQQTITVAKAGILMQLNTRCAVLAAARHKSVERESILPSLKLSPPLISRFDLILSLADTRPDNTAVARNILDRASDEYCVSYIKEALSRQKTVHVTMEEPCRVVIGKFYEKQRAASSFVTVRALESHIRLTEAYARLMQRSEAVEKDALITTLLLNGSLSLKRLWDLSFEHVVGSEESLAQALQIIKADLLSQGRASTQSGSMPDAST